MPKKETFKVLMPEGFELNVEDQYHRLHQERLKLVRRGVIPKSEKIIPAMVKRFVVVFGYENLKNVDYLTFVKMYKETFGSKDFSS